jgi:hypothetical protein
VRLYHNGQTKELCAGLSGKAARIGGCGNAPGDTLTSLSLVEGCTSMLTSVPLKATETDDFCERF